MHSASTPTFARPADPHEPAESLDASDEFRPLDVGSYCPTELLGTFTLLMAGGALCQH